MPSKQAHMNDQGELAGSSLDPTTWTGGKTRILVWVQEKVVTWRLFSMLSPGTCHGMPNSLDESARGNFTFLVLLIKGKRLFPILFPRQIDQLMLWGGSLSVEFPATFSNYRVR